MAWKESCLFVAKSIMEYRFGRGHETMVKRVNNEDIHSWENKN